MKYSAYNIHFCSIVYLLLWNVVYFGCFDLAPLVLKLCGSKPHTVVLEIIAGIKHCDLCIFR